MRVVATPLRYVYALLRDLVQGALGLRAMNLVYWTLFAVVPLVAASFSVLKAFGYHEDLEPVLFEFLKPLGERGTELTIAIMGFVGNVQGTVLGTVGFAFLLYTAISMIQKVESSLNFVWHVERPRSLGRRVTEYLVVLLVGPALAVVAMGLLASIEASDVVARLSSVASGGRPATSQVHVAPYLLVVALFTFMYQYIPNTRVRFPAAFVGALFGGIVWATVGAIFTRIVVYSTQTLAVYAGFAVVLLFLVWLHLSWLIFLLGSQLSFYVQHPEYLRTGHSDIPVSGAMREKLGLALMYLVAQRFMDGGPRWTIGGLADRLDVPAIVLGEIVDALEAHGLLLGAEDDSVSPARDLANIRVAAILDAIRHEVTDPRRPKPRAVAATDEIARAADEAMRASSGERTLRDLVSQPR
jgi:membrane protein